MSKWYGLDRSGDFDQQALAGVNIYGDFDQLSLGGVDFGEDYCVDYGIEPVNLEGEELMGSYHQMGIVPQGLSGQYEQLGADYDQLGIVPEGMGKYEQQLGLVPQGLGTHNYQMGLVPSGLSGIPSGLGGMMDDMKAKWASLSPMHKGLAALALVAGGAYLLRQTGVIKRKLPVIG